MSYKIVRSFQKGTKIILRRGVTLEEAQTHCNNPETSSKTCKKSHNKARTHRMGEWFDGYERE